MTDPDVDVLIDNVTWLLSTGEHPSRIARRLGRSPHAIDQTLRRAGRGDLAAAFYTERDRERTSR